MAFLPVITNMKQLALKEVMAKSQSEGKKNFKNTLHSEQGFGESRAIKQEADARANEADTLVEKAVGIPMYHGLIEMFTTALTPIGTPLGIPRFVIKLIAQSLVDAIFGKPNEQPLPATATIPSPKIGTPPSANPYVPDPLGSLPNSGNLQKAPGKTGRGA